MKTINQEDFTKSLSALLKETFESTNTAFGTMYLDQGTGLFATLEKIDADKASQIVSDASPTIAAHCEHIRFYLDFLNNYIKEDYKMADWKDSWKIKTVTDAEWTTLRGQLHKAYQNITDTFEEVENWNDFKISGAMGILAHTAYHLSAIRQTMKIV